MKRLFPGIYLISGALLAVGLLALFLYLGNATSQPALASVIPGAISPVVESQLVATHTVQYIDRPVTVVERIERVERIPVELRDYQNLEELRQWLAKADQNITTIYFQRPEVTVDCDDFALALQQKALADGYVMSFQIITPVEYNRLFQKAKIPAASLHAINLAVIGNDAYYIEPQTGEVVFAAHLD